MNNTTESNQQFAPGQSPEDRAVIPVVEERVIIDKQVVETGRIYLDKKVHEQEVSVNVPSMHEEVDVERVTVNQYVDTAPPAVRYEGETMIIPVLREEVVVQKRLVLVEELRVTRRQVLTHTPESVTLRKEEVTVERSGNNPAAKPY